MMKFQENDHDRMLEKLLSEMSKRQLDENTASRSAERVWSTLDREQTAAAPAPPAEAVDRIQSCEDVQVLIPAYLANALLEGRRLLVQDHLQECVSCRKALREQKEGRKVHPAPPAPARRRVSFATLAWAAAAVVLLGVSLLQFGVLEMILPPPAAPSAVVALVEGNLFRVSPQGITPLKAGDAVIGSEELRTGRDSGAVLTMSDGSRVELGDRAELSVSGNRDGKLITLSRGSIIVEAAKQRDGFLRVATEDCLVSVKGTVFAVRSGTKGSRVSVVEGTVAVEQEGRSALLTAGEQVSTRSNLVSVPVEEDISWSRNASRHIALLRELTALQKQIESSLTPAVHGSTALLDLMPADTAVYISIPNLTMNLDEAFSVFQQRVAESVPLQQWWSEGGAELEPRITETLDRLRTFGAYLGEELVLGLAMTAGGEPSEPVVLAEVTATDSAFRSLLEAEIERLNVEAGTEAILLLDNPFLFVPDPEFQGLYAFLADGFFVASSSLDQLRHVVTSIQTATGTFAGSPFHERIRQAYADGIGFLAAVDLRAFLERKLGTDETADPTRIEGLRALGILDIEHVIVERKPGVGHPETRAAISFSDARKGLASWLAEPAPIGALDFVSANATAVTAFAVKDPALMVEDLLQFMSSVDPEALDRLHLFEQERGISILDHIARPLGGEMVFALDGPVLPEPAWKFVLEVYDPARLQETLEWLIGQINLESGADGPQLDLLTNQADGITYYSIVSGKSGRSADYMFVDGSYLVAAPSRALLVNTLQFRETGYTFVNSEKFLSLLPEDGRINFSAFFYQDFGAVLSTLSGQLPASIGSLSPEDAAGIQEILAEVQPTLVAAYGEPDQITLAGVGDALSPLSMGGVMGIASPLGLGKVLKEIEREAQAGSEKLR